MFYENIGTPVRSSTKYFVALSLVLLLVGMGYSVYLYNKTHSPPVPEKSGPKQQTLPRTEIPLVSSPKSEWPKLVIPAGESKPVSLPLEMHHVVTAGVGDGPFLLYNLYRDGHKCAFGESCPDGDVTGYLVENTGEKEKTVLYAFVPIGR